MKYAQVAAELKAKGELDKVIGMLQQMGQVDYVFYYEDVEDDHQDEGKPTWCYVKEFYFGRQCTGLQQMLLDNYPGMNSTPCLLVEKENIYLAPVGCEFEYEVWEDELAAGKVVVEGSPFESRRVRVDFNILYSLCPEVFDQELLPPGNEKIGAKYWFVPEGLGLNYEVGQELLAACQAA